MKVSWNWLRELVKLDDGLGPHEAAARLSGAGVAVDAVTAIGTGISGVIVAEVRAKRPHPKADKLTLVDVFDGKEVTQVVCGAPNVPSPGEPGRSPRVAWARPGAKLPNGLELSVREVRGQKSQVVFHRGDLCEGLYLVVYGRVKLSISSAQGVEKVIEIIQPGQSFAEAVMFLGTPCPVACR